MSQSLKSISTHFDFNAPGGRYVYWFQGGFWPAKERQSTLALTSGFSHTCISQTHFLTSCLAECFLAGEITVPIESDFIDWEEKADGKRRDEKRLKERWIEIILLRWYTYNRHGLYLWLDCFFRGMRKVPFHYNTDIHSVLYAWNLKAFSSLFVFVLPYRCAVDCQWFLLLLQFIFSGRQRLPFPLVLLQLSSRRQIWSTAKPLSTFPAFISAIPHSSSRHDGLFSGLSLPSGSPDICCPTWASPGRVWHNSGLSGPSFWTTSQRLWRCAFISSPRN